jgi:CHAD domain-containing protein
LDKPLHAQPPELTRGMSLPQTAQRVLREMFCQFITNLNALRSSDEPEVVHQARVGWRRFKSAVRLFRPVLTAEAVPSWQPLQALLTCLGELRDLDVARTETLPPFAQAYAAGDGRRAESWQTMIQALAYATDLQRKAVRYALQEPELGASLLAITHWLEGLSDSSGAGDAAHELNVSLRQWAKRRILHLHDQLKRGLKKTDNPDNLHRVRILAKRLRYGIEALKTLLSKRVTQRWYLQATNLQTVIGASRDLVQASTLVARLDVDRGLVEFLRGVALGQTRQS